ncbi:MAG: GHMP kinase [Planctomycetes bacterium]|nr:GHMP kinase [Planctomycetota bacterium]MBL7038707.1 GHMP kinase [Pirellulaceae bacterium]
MEIIRKRGYARAGLIGNPSDGYNGKTISLIVREFHADVILYEWEELELILSQEDHTRFGSIDELTRDVKVHGYYGGVRLVKATIKRFAEYCEGRYALHDRNFSIRYETSIPRCVGLAGSSAIIVATLHALMEFYQVSIPPHVQPSLALSVETDELGIVAGLQDRVIQAYEGLVYMDFAREAMRNEQGYTCGIYERIDTKLLPPLYIAYRVDVAEPTEVLHNRLRARYEEGDPEVHAAMEKFADLAVRAKAALLAGDAEELSRLIDENFDTRQSICQLHEDHVQMIEAARSVGASAKFAGSGGAIIGVYKDEAMYAELKEKLEAIDCRVFKPTIA